MDFELSVILALGFERLGWDTPDDTEITEEAMKAALLNMGMDFDLLREEAQLSEHVKIYQARVDSCGEEPQYRIAKSGYLRLRDNAQAKLDLLRREKGA